jgi:hypothetical protein
MLTPGTDVVGPLCNSIEPELGSSGNLWLLLRSEEGEITMKRSLAFLFIALAAVLTLACGSSHRQLQSITVNATENGSALVATGTFSAPPTTVTPLPVFWSTVPPPAQYVLTTQLCTVQLEVLPPPGGMVAMAPADPTAPNSGSISTTRMISSVGLDGCTVAK